MHRTLVPFVFAVSATLLPAQLSGSYLIDPAGGGSTFPSFQAAVNALFVNGSAGPVQFLVMPGIYTESVLVPPLPGVSAQNPVTFRSVNGPGTVTLIGAGGDTFALIGVSFQPNIGLVFDGLDFDQAPGFAISGTRFVGGIEVRHCRFGPEHRANAVGEFRHALIAADYAGSEPGWHIHHNRLTFPGRTTRTAYGIYLSNGGGWQIHDNQIDVNGCDYGIYLINQNRRLDTIWNNTFFGSLAVNNGTSANGTCVIRADISNYDNDIVHNTFFIHVPGAVGSCIASSGISGNPPATNRIHGNVFVMTGPGTCIVSGATSPLVSDGNVFWAPLGEIGRLGSTTPGMTTLAAWQSATGQDGQSQNADPMFRNASAAPYDLRVQPGSPVVGAAVATPGYVDHDLAGRLRDAQPDAGAYESTSFALYGQGCPGSGGSVPMLSGSGAVALGSTSFALDLQNAPPNVLALLFGGLSRTSASGQTLPFPLGGGCAILAAPDAVRFALTDPAGATSLPFFIPNNPALLDTDVFFQFAVLDPAAPSAFGVTVTEAGALQL